MRLFLKEHNFLLLLLVFTFIPGLLFLSAMLFGIEKLPKRIRPSHHLTGITSQLEKPQFNLAQLKSHEIQKYLEDFFSSRLPLRSTLIRLNNQIFYSLFNKSYSNTPCLVVGKHKQLFEQPYIAAYCGFEGPALYTTQQLQEWANTIKRLDNYYRKQGKMFIYVISPSKAEYMPETIPTRFHCTTRGVSKAVNVLTQLLNDRHVRYINGPELMVAGTKKYGIPMFGPGGTHWNDLGATIAVNQIIDKMNTPPLHFTFQLKKPKLDAVDCDLLNLSNLLFPSRNYLVPEISYTSPCKNRQTKKISMIGGSFSITLFNILKKTNSLRKSIFIDTSS